MTLDAAYGDLLVKFSDDVLYLEYGDLKAKALVKDLPELIKKFEPLFVNEDGKMCIRDRHVSVSVCSFSLGGLHAKHAKRVRHINAVIIPIIFLFILPYLQIKF